MFKSEARLKPLIERYEELKGKATLNKVEQDELRKVIDEIQKVVPQAATAFDVYGRALDINKDKVREYLDQNKNLTKEMKQLANQNIQGELRDLAKKQLQLTTELNQGYTEVYEQGVRSERKLTTEQIVQRQIALNDIKKKTDELGRALVDLNSGLSKQSPGGLPTAGGSGSKTSTEPDSKLKAAIEKYNAEKIKLEQEYGKERLETLKADELKYIDEKAKFSKQQIELERQTYLAVKRAAKGENATLSPNENKLFDDRLGFVDTLANSEKAKYQEELDEKAKKKKDEEIEAESNTQRQINYILADAYQKRLQELEYSYGELLDAARKNGADTVKLEADKQKKIKEIELDAKLNAVDKEKQNALDAAELSVLQAQIDGRVDLELEARNQMLELEKQFNEKKIEIIKASGVEEVNARILPLTKANLAIKKEQGEVSKSLSKFNDIFKKDFWLKQIGVDTKEGEEAIMGFVYEFSSSMNELIELQARLTQARLSRIDEEISAKQTQVDREKELDEQGLANNLGLREKEMEILKSQREKAVEDARKMQKAQLAIDTAMQLSSLITATAKLFSAHAGVPFVGTGWAIAATALMWGAFAAAKIKAFQLTQAEKYEFGGEVGGRRHKDGGTMIEAEKGEYVTNRKSTAKYYELIEAINEDKQGAIMDYLIRDLLSSTGVSASESERHEHMKFIQEYRETVKSAENETIKELQAMRAELKEIKLNSARIPKKQYVSAGENKVAEITENSTIVRELPKG